MKKWIDITEKDAQERKQKEDQYKQKQKEVKDYLLMQMGEVQSSVGVPSVISMNKRKGKGSMVNVPMSAEELRINKQLLKEIRKKKKEKTMGLNGLTSELSLSDANLVL